MSAILLFVVLVLLGARIARELIDVPQALVNLFRRYVESVEPSFARAALGAWLILGGIVAWFFLPALLSAR